MIMLNNNLHIFITAAELGSLTEAAKKLYVTQPAISHAIKKLEDELGVQIFHRENSKLSLNETGKVAAEYADGLITAQLPALIAPISGATVN